MGTEKENTNRRAKNSQRRGLHFEPLEPRILFDASGGSAPTAEVDVSTGGLTVNEDQLINDNIEFSITFDNNGGQEGYVPYVDFLALPEMDILSVGAFGVDVSNPAGPSVDPIGMVSATGELVDISTGNPIDHPQYSTSIGSPSSDFFGGAGSGSEPVTFDPSFQGYYVYSAQLPFGSYTPGNPPASISVEASLNDADGIVANTSYELHARGGFALGCDALDNPGTVATPDDEPVFGAFASSSVYPVVMDLVKSASVAEGEADYTGENASGPNHPVTYRLAVDIADGETISNLRLTDVLPDDLAYLGNLTITDGSGGVIGFSILDQPAVASDDINGVAAADNTIDINFPSVTGGAGTDIIVTYEAFIPYIEEGGNLVINEDSGEEGDLDEYNDARITGDWTSSTQGPSIPVSDNAGPATGGDPDGVLGGVETDYRIEEHSLAIQKGVGFVADDGINGSGDRNATGWSEGDVAEFTMNFQISDYFAFGSLLVTDSMGDGLEFLPDLDPMSSWANASDFDTDVLGNRPVLTFEMHSGVGGTIDVAFDESNFSATENPGDGSTTMVFNVYQQLVDSGFIVDGEPLLGGMIPAAGLGANPMGSFNSNVGTRGSITYNARVRNEYANAVGDTDVNQGDTLTNNVIIEGSNLDVRTLTPNGNLVSDDSGASIEIATGSITKELFSTTRNGQQTLAADLDGGLEVVPGDVITWRMVYELPISEFENLTISDFLPLPVFDVSEIDTSQIYSYDSNDYLIGGRISFGPNDTFFGPNGAGTPADGIESLPGYLTPTTPTILPVDTDNNSFTIDFGDYDIPEAEDPIATQIEIFVSTTITDAVYAEGLQFTNQVAASESDSFNDTVASNEIAQINLGVPDLTITKGVLAIDSTSGGSFVGSRGPAGVTFTAPGSANAFTGTITSDGLDSDPIDADAQDLDAGDVVTFGIVVQNRGNSDYGAFDVEISDTIPSGFTTPASLADLNLRVTDGDGNALAYTIKGGGTTAADFFANGIELIDPDPNVGSLAEYNGTDGTNIVLVAYDLVVDSSVEFNETLQNVAVVDNFSYKNGGPNYAEASDQDVADVSIIRPSVVKTVVDTSHDDVANLEVQKEVAIGEVVTYSVVVTIPEGTLTNAIVRDSLPSGMAFVGVDSISFSSGLETTKGATDFSDVDVYYNADASQLELGVGGTAGLGTVTNTNTDNTVAEQITITYKAVVLNDVVNQAGLVRSNDVELLWQENGSNQIEEDSGNVRVVEPNISVSKSVLGGDTSVEGADEVTYRITVQNVNSNGNVSEAYNVELSDLLPEDVSFVSVGAVTGTAPAPSTGPTFNPGPGPEGEITVSWDVFGVGQTAQFDVVVRIDNTLPTDRVITNSANIEFTSLPDEPGDAGYTGYNPATDSGTFSTPGAGVLVNAVERTGDPTDPGGAANDYDRTNSASVTVINPIGIDKVVVDTSEDHTTPDSAGDNTVRAAIGEVVRYEVRILLPQAASTDVELIDTLGPELLWLAPADNNIEIRLEGFDPAGTTLTADADIAAANGSTIAIDPARVSFNAGSNTVTFDFGDITNTETDATPEYIYVAYNAIIKNDTGVDRGDVVTNTVQLREGGSDIGPPLTQSVTVVEPELTIAKSDNGTTTADAGDIIDYTLTITAGTSTPQTHATAFDLVITDVLPDELDLVGGSVAFVGASLGTINEDLVADSFNVNVSQLDPGDSFQVTFQAEVRDTGADIIRANETVTNTASLTYSTLPLDGTEKDSMASPTGNTTGSEAGIPGDPDGERVTSTSNSDSFSSPNPVLTKVLANPADTTFTIGEPVEYVINLQVPEGQTGGPLATIIDAIDPGFRFVPGTLMVTTGPGVTVATAGALTEANASFFTHTDSGNTADPEQLSFDFGSVTFHDAAAGDGVASGSIEIRYFLQVENILANQQGDTLNNTADFQYTDGDSAATVTLQDTNDNDTIITIVEPQVDSAKTITTLPDPAQAGETVVYEVTLTNPGGPMNPQQNVTAFEVTSQDTIPTGLTFDSSSFAADFEGTDITASFVLNADGWTLPAGANIDLGPGEVITITYAVTIDTEVRDGEIYTNTVDVDWTSLDNDNATDGIDASDTGERGGFGDLDTDNPGGDPNDYEDTATVDMPVNLTPVFDFEKTIIDTSFADTGVAAGTSATTTDLVIGETVTYQLVATLPRGTVDSVRVVDQLALDNGLLDITNVQITAGAALTLPGGAALTTVMPSIIDSATADGYDDRVVFDFGTVINTPPVMPVAGDDQIVITITALVVNDEENQQGDVITNTGQLLYLDDHDGNGSRTEQVIESTVDVEIIEPQIDTNKRTTSLPANMEAGETVSYEVTLTNVGGAGNLEQLTTAYEVTARDVLPADLVLQTASFQAILNNGATNTDITPAFVTGTSGWELLATADIDLGPGHEITITYDAVIAVTVNDQDLLTNEVDTEWTSLDGTVANERGGNANPTDKDDYESGDEVTIQTNFEPAITKRVLSTTENGSVTANGTDPLLEDLVIGEGVTYEIVVTLGRGTTENVRIFDQLEIDEGLLDISTVQVFHGSALSPQGGGSLNTTALITDNLGMMDGHRDTVDLVLGNVVNNATGPESADEQIRILVTAAVLNVAENQQGDVIDNNVDLFYTADPDGDGNRTLESIRASASLEIVEPQVDVLKETTSVPSPAEAGATISYRVILTNPGGPANLEQNVTAYEVTAQDVLPSGIQLVTTSFSAFQGATDITGSFSTATSGWNLPAVSDIDLAPGESIVITYDAVIQSSVRDGDALTNEVDIEWTSVNGAGTTGINGERGGDSDLDTTGTAGPSNDYENNDDVTVRADLTPVFDFSKSVLSTSENHGTAAGTNATFDDLVIGETVTYELVATMGRGTTDGVRIVDQLSIANGLLDITSVSISGGAALSLPSGTIDGLTPTITDNVGMDGYQDRVEFVIGTVTNDPALITNAASEQIRVLITAVVVNDTENQQGDVIENTATFFFMDDPDGDGTRTEESIEDTANVEIIEPQVDTTKTIDSQPADPQAGDTISYIVTLNHPGGPANQQQNVTAYDITAQDVLPTNLDLVTTSFTALLDGVDISAQFVVTADGWITSPMADIDLDPGKAIVIEYDAVIAKEVRDQETLLNEVDVEWTSLDGTNGGERGGDGNLATDANPTDADNYESGDTAQFLSNLSPVYDFTKSIASTSLTYTDADAGTDVGIEDLVIGETVTYELVATLAKGTTDGVRIVDQLDIANGLLDITNVEIIAGDALSLGSGDPFSSLTINETDNAGMDGYNDRVDINFGTVVNDPALDTGAESQQIRVLITALVVNDIENQDLDVIENTGTFTYLDDGDGMGPIVPQTIEDSVEVEIVEPEVNTTKTITNLPADPMAGERVTYEVTLSNPAPVGTENVIAFDVIARDALPTNLALDTGSFTAILNGAIDASGFFLTTTSGWTTDPGTPLDLNQGDEIIITYEAVIQPGVRDGDNLLNQVDVEWSSIQGTDTNERGGFGDLDTEAPADEPNDYETGVNADFDAEFSSFYDFSKEIVSTSEGHTGVLNGTDAGITDLVVGETVTFSLKATLGRGTTDGVRIIDQLPAIEGVLDITNVTINPGAALSLQSGNPFSSITPMVTDSVDSDGYNDRVVIDFGTVVNNPALAMTVADEQIEILVEAVVVNIAANTGGDVIENTADFYYFDDPDGDGTQTEQVQSDDAFVEILEPNLGITKAVDNDMPRLDEVLTYTLTITNNAGTSTTDAFDLVIDDLMDPRMTLDPSSVDLVILGAPANPSSIVSNTSTSNNLILGIDRLDEGEAIEITYEVRVSSDPADFDAVFPNDVDLHYSSTEGPNPNERGGDPDTNDPNDPDTYQDSDDESVEVFQPDLHIEKVDYDVSITPGSPVIYEMTVTNQGRAEALNVTVTDDISHYLAAGFRFVSGTNATLTDGVVTFVLPDMPVSDVQVITLTLQAPEVIPAGLESITNIAVANHDDIDPTPLDNEDPEETPIIARPDLVVAKDDGLLLAVTGDHITYVITFTNVGDQIASGIIIEDELPPEMKFISASNGGILRGDSVFWGFEELAPGEVRTVEVTAEVIRPGLKLNTVTIKDDGRGGPDPTPENNEDIDETNTRWRFRYDLTQDFRTSNGNLTLHDHRWDHDRLIRREPVILATYMASGLAQAGSTITLEVYDERGQLIADTSVVTDAGGNWLASFPMADVEKQPARIEMKQTWASYNPAGERSYNFRTYFGPAFSTGTYYTEQLTVHSVMEKRNATEVIDLYESSKMILAMDWNGQLYEFAARGALQSSSGN